MDWGYLLLIAATFSVLLIVAQRMVTRTKRLMRGFIFVMGLLLLARGNLTTETLIGFFIAIVISFLFWLIIGRYNAAPEDQIKVYGMDD